MDGAGTIYGGTANPAGIAKFDRDGTFRGFLDLTLLSSVNYIEFLAADPDGNIHRQ